MAELDEQFTQAQADVQSLSKRPDNDTLLKLYALYKQGSKGDVSGKRPGFTDFAGRAKFDAWSKQKGTASDTAKQSYVDLVNKLLGR